MTDLCDRQRCKRKAEVAPKIIVPRRADVAPDRKLDYGVMLRAKLCRRCFRSMDAAAQAARPDFQAYVRAGAQARAKQARRPYEEPDFARAVVESVKLGSKEYIRLAAQFGGGDG